MRVLSWQIERNVKYSASRHCISIQGTKSSSRQDVQGPDSPVSLMPSLWHHATQLIYRRQDCTVPHRSYRREEASTLVV